MREVERRGVNIVQPTLVSGRSSALHCCLRDKILAKLGAEICGCKKQGNVNTTEESYGPEVRLGGGGNVVEIEKMRPRQKRRNRGLQRTIGPPDNVLCIFL